MTFTKDLQAAIQKKVLKVIGEGSWLSIDYNDRVNVPVAMLQECYEAIDMERVKARLVDRLEDKLADKIFNNLATEIATDVKSIMSNTELREQCRGILRDHMKSSAFKLIEGSKIDG